MKFPPLFRDEAMVGDTLRLEIVVGPATRLWGIEQKIRAHPSYWQKTPFTSSHPVAFSLVRKIVITSAYIT